MGGWVWWVEFIQHEGRRVSGEEAVRARWRMVGGGRMSVVVRVVGCKAVNLKGCRDRIEKR